MNGKNKRMIDELNKERKEGAIKKATSTNHQDSNNVDDTSTSSSSHKKALDFLSSDKSSSSTNSSDNSYNSSSNNINSVDTDEIADNQLQKLQQEYTQSEMTSTSSNKASNSNNETSSEIQSNTMKSQLAHVANAQQNLQVTQDEQGQDDLADSQIAKLTSKNSENNSSEATVSASDPATTSQGQRNLARNEKQNQPDLQDVTSPNLFIVRARNFHNRMLKLLNKYAYTYNKNNAESDVINSIISLEDEVFKNLCNGFSMIIMDNNRRNNEVEARTEHLQKQASAGAKTIKLWQNEGIFANLRDELGELSDVLHDPRFQAFAQKTKTADLNIPKTLAVKGKQASENVTKENAQQEQNKGGSKK